MESLNVPLIIVKMATYSVSQCKRDTPASEFDYKQFVAGQQH